MPKKNPQPTINRKDDPEQSRLFIEKAREIGADEALSAADELLGALHSKPPEPHKPVAPKPKRKKKAPAK